VFTLRHRLLDHLAEVSGSVPDLVDAKVTGLPLFLRERYQFGRTRLFGQSFLLALAQGNPETATPGEYEKHADTLRNQAGDQCERDGAEGGFHVGGAMCAANPGGRGVRKSPVDNRNGL